MTSKISTQQQFLFALIPIILFTVVEEYGGLVWALILSVIYAVGEMSWEWWRYQRISKMTLFSNSMVVSLSLVSYLTQDGLWFKLQPAILELVMAFILIGSFILKKPLLLTLLEQQQPQQSNPILRLFFKGLTLRMGFFFLAQAGLAVYASLYWSTEAWAFLKSIGVILMMVIYMILEVIIFRFCQMRQMVDQNSDSTKKPSKTQIGEL